MRHLRSLLLLAILAILAGVGVVYQVQKRAARENAPGAPPPLPPEITSSASNWTWSKQVNQRTVVKVSAKSIKELKNPARVNRRADADECAEGANEAGERHEIGEAGIQAVANAGQVVTHLVRQKNCHQRERKGQPVHP